VVSGGISVTYFLAKDEIMTESEIKKAHCANCKGSRNCDIRGEFDDGYSDEVISGNTKWLILQCRGCETVFVQTVSTNSEDYDYAERPYGESDIEYNERISYWPAILRRERPQWFEHGIEAENVGSLSEVMTELYVALEKDLAILSAIGIRTSFDVASGLLGVEERLPFNKKLEQLVSLGKIGASDSERLAALVDAGSASAHRGWSAKSEDLSTMVEILEHFVFDAFVHPHRAKKLDEQASKLRARVPARGKDQNMPKNEEPLGGDLGTATNADQKTRATAKL